MKINILNKDGLDTINNIVEDGEAEEIVITNNVLEMYFYDEAIKLINVVVKKLRHGGVISISFLDMYFIAQAILAREVNTQQLNKLLYCDGRHSVVCMSMLSDLMTNNGLKILVKRLQDGVGVIKAQRP